MEFYVQLRGLSAKLVAAEDALVTGARYSKPFKDRCTRQIILNAIFFGLFESFLKAGSRETRADATDSTTSAIRLIF